MIDPQIEQDKILRFAQLKFSNEGFYKISMDEISHELQISKKTIYKYFPSKEKLVEAIIENTVCTVNKEVDAILGTEEDIVTKYVKFMNMYCHIVANTKEKWLKDLQLHMPELWQRIDKFRTDKIYSGLNRLLQQGRKEKFIENYPSEIIIACFVSTIRATMDPDFILRNRFSIEQAFIYTFEMLLNGILTRAGKEKYQKVKKEIFEHDHTFINT
jgi:AcrR family transcriptional regulator